MKLTVDNSSKASMPGQIKISRKKYLDYLGLSGIIRLRYLLLFYLPKKILFKLFHSDIIVFHFIQTTERFLYGCLNPTIIINKNKKLIATFTNLTSHGNKVTPVIKISEEPLHLIKNIKIENGQKLPTVALYERNPKDIFASAWIDFDPKIANCFTDDIKACNKLLSRITDKGWKCLAEGLSQLEDHEAIGLYHVKIDAELVRNA